jgi:hypothetical protein
VEWGSVVGSVTAFATMLTALGGFLVAIRVLIPTRKQIQAVHTIVNQQKTDMERYQRALVAALSEHGITIPVDQSKD